MGLIFLMIKKVTQEKGDIIEIKYPNIQDVMEKNEAIQSSQISQKLLKKQGAFDWPGTKEIEARRHNLKVSIAAGSKTNGPHTESNRPEKAYWQANLALGHDQWNKSIGKH